LAAYSLYHQDENNYSSEKYTKQTYSKKGVAEKNNGVGGFLRNLLPWT
jgi:hypothetical protein